MIPERDRTLFQVFFLSSDIKAIIVSLLFSTKDQNYFFIGKIERMPCLCHSLLSTNTFIAFNLFIPAKSAILWLVRLL